MDTWKKSLTFAATAALIATPVSAQTGTGSLGLFGTWSEGSELAKTPTSEFELDNSWGGGATMEFWMGGGRQFGLRFDGSYTRPDLPEALASPMGGEDLHASVWTADANLMLRLWDVSDDTHFVPFLSAGGGSVWWDPRGDAEGMYENPDINFTDTQQAWAVTAGGGADIFLSDNVALRLEAKDYYVPSLPFSDGESDHNIQYRAGLNFFWGGGGEIVEPGFVQEEVEPEPEVVEKEVEPEPVAEPVTRSESVCVVGDDGRLTTVTATRYVDTDRLTVDENGREVDFQTAYPATAPTYVQGASWYMNNGSLDIYLDEDAGTADETEAMDSEGHISHLEFVTFGAPTSMTAGDLVYVGEVQGTPVYAVRADMQAIMPRLNTRLNAEDDLEVILRDDEDLARDFSNLRTLYVATEPGCAFQPISLTTYVRRTRG